MAQVRDTKERERDLHRQWLRNPQSMDDEVVLPCGCHVFAHKAESVVNDDGTCIYCQRSGQK